jgi:hypothetical protein
MITQKMLESESCLLVDVTTCNGVKFSGSGEDSAYIA